MTTATATRTVLLTGADEPLGRLVLKRLQSTPRIGKILVAGPAKGKKVKAIKVAPTSEKILGPLRDEKVDTILHVALQPAKGRDENVFEKNVLGTMTLLGAAAEAKVRQVVLRSSYTVYGPLYNNPNYIPEGRRVRLSGKSQFQRDVAEMERYAQDFLKHFGDTRLTILRFAPIIGPGSDSPFMRYLRQEACPVILGFDPLLQLLHEEDAADAVVAAGNAEVAGPVNVAPDGVVPLLKVLRFLKREMLIVPHLPMQASEKLLATLRRLPFDAGFLRFACCLDNARMKEDLRFAPRHTSSETLRALEGLD